MGSWTITYREDSNGWVSFKSFIPEYGMSLSNDYFTFKEGELWQHHKEGTDANSFYQPQPITNSYVDVLFNNSPDIIKHFNTISYEGTQSKILGHAKNYHDINYKAGWFVESIITDEGRDNEQHGTIPEFIEKEGKWFNYIKGEQSTWNSANDYNLDSSEFSFQGLGNMITQPSTTLPINIPVLFGVVDSGDDDTTSWANTFPYTNPISSTYAATLLGILVGSSQPYYFGNPFTPIAYGGGTFFPKSVESTTNAGYPLIPLDSGYISRSNVNDVISGNTVSGYQTITLKTGENPEDPTNPFSAICAHDLRINGFFLGTHMNDNYINYSGGASNFSNNSAASLLPTCYKNYTIEHPNGWATNPLFTYTLGSSNTEVIVKYIEIEEDYTTEYDNLSSSGVDTHPGHIHIKIHFEDFLAPPENIVVPIDIDYETTLNTTTAVTYNLTVNMEPGTLENMALDQYLQTRSSENFTIQNLNIGTGMTTIDLGAKTPGTMQTSTVHFYIYPIDEYTIGNNATSQEDSGGNVNGNVWGEACDNLTNQSLMAFGVHTEYPDNTGSAVSSGYASWSDNYGNTTNYPHMGYWLGSLGAGINTLCATSETLEIDQSGTNNYNVHSSYASNYGTSLDKIEKIDFLEYYTGTMNDDSFPTYIKVSVKLNFMMPYSDVNIHVPVQHNTEYQISSLPVSPWEFGCTDPLAINQTTFTNTPVNNTSCTFPPPPSHDIRIHYIKDNQFIRPHGGATPAPVGTPTMGWAFPHRYRRMEWGSAWTHINIVNMTQTLTHTITCQELTSVATAFPNGIITNITAPHTYQFNIIISGGYHVGFPTPTSGTYPNSQYDTLPINNNEKAIWYPGGRSTDNLLAHSLRVFGSGGVVDGTAIVPMWYEDGWYHPNFMNYGSAFGCTFLQGCLNAVTTPNIISQKANDELSTKRIVSMASLAPDIDTSTSTPTGATSGTYQDSIDKIDYIKIEEIYQSGQSYVSPFPNELRLTTKLDFTMPQNDVDIYVPINQNIEDLITDPNNQ